MIKYCLGTKRGVLVCYGKCKRVVALGYCDLAAGTYRLLSSIFQRLSASLANMIPLMVLRVVGSQALETSYFRWIVHHIVGKIVCLVDNFVHVTPS